MFTSEKDKEAKVLNLRHRITLLESRGEHNRSIVKSLTRELRRLEK